MSTEPPLDEPDYVYVGRTLDVDNIIRAAEQQALAARRSRPPRTWLADARVDEIIWLLAERAEAAERERDRLRATLDVLDDDLIHSEAMRAGQEARADAALALLREIAGHLCDCGTECYSGPERQSRIDAFLASQPQETP